jgi:hypothetical protein
MKDGSFWNNTDVRIDPLTLFLVANTEVELISQKSEPELYSPMIFQKNSLCRRRPIRRRKFVPPKRWRNVMFALDIYTPATITKI